MADEIARQTGRAPRLARFPWSLMRLAAPVWDLARKFGEMRYLYGHPHRLEGATLERLLPGFRMAPFVQVVAGHLIATKLPRGEGR